MYTKKLRKETQLILSLERGNCYEKENVETVDKFSTYSFNAV